MQTKPNQPHTILVVEDDVFIRIDIADYLRGCGWHVVEAGTAAEAVNVDFVFSDVQMPGAMDGFDLAAWVRQHRPDLRIILTSGVVQRTEAATSLCDEGPIGKPYDHDHLAQRIRHHLASTAAGRSGA